MTSSSTAPNIIYGTLPINFLDKEEVQKLVAHLLENGVTEIDTGRIYTDNERVIGEYKLPEKFIVHTKSPGFGVGSLSKDGVNDAIKESLKLLGVSSVETYYLHSPDPSTPIEETLEAINELY